MAKWILVLCIPSIGGVVCNSVTRSIAGNHLLAKRENPCINPCCAPSLFTSLSIWNLKFVVCQKWLNDIMLSQKSPDNIRSLPEKLTLSPLTPCAPIYAGQGQSRKSTAANLECAQHRSTRHQEAMLQMLGLNTCHPDVNRDFAFLSVLFPPCPA